MPRAIRFAGALALAMALLVLVPSLAAAAPRWLAPADLTPAGGAVFTPRVVVDSQGNALAAWTADNAGGRVVRASSRPAGATAWSAPVDISPTPVVGFADLAVDPAGNVIAVWAVPSQGSGIAAATVQVAIRPAGAAAFGPPQDVSAPGAYAVGLGLGVDASGGLVVVWSQGGPENGAPGTVMTSSRPAGGGAWSAPEALSTPGEHALYADVAASGDGRAVAVWSSMRAGADVRTVRARVRDAAGGPWSPEREISDPKLPVAEPAVAMGPGGEAVAAWTSGTAVDPTARAASRAPGGDWGAPEDLGEGGVPIIGAQPLIEPDGTATVAWLRGLGGQVVARIRPPGGAFGPLQVVSPADVPVEPLPSRLIAGGPQGGVIAVWSRNRLGTPTVVQAAIKAPGGLAFGPAADVSAKGRAGISASGALAPGGEALATWVETATPAGVVKVAEYTERPGAVLQDPPVAVRGVEAPKRAVAGTIVPVRVDFASPADLVPVRVQRRGPNGFADVSPVARVTGATAVLPVRLAAGSAVLRVAYEDRGAPAYSGTVTVRVAPPASRLVAAGDAPRAVRVGAGATWVLTSEGGEGVVLKLNSKTGQRVGAPIPVGRAASIAVGAGAVWLARVRGVENGLARIDPTTGVVTEIPIVGGGVVATGPAGVWAVECTLLGNVPGSCVAQRVVRIDPATSRVTRRVTVITGEEDPSERLRSLFVGRRFVWAVVDGDDASWLRRIDPARGTLGVRVGNTGLWAASGDILWGLASRRCELVRVRGMGSPVTLRRVPGSFRRGCSALVAGPRDLWVVQGTPSRGDATIGETPPARLVRLDARTLRAIGRPIPLGTGSIAVDVGAGAVWAASAEEGVVRRIDPRPAARGTAASPRPRPVRPATGWSRPTAISGASGRSARGLALAAAPGGRTLALWSGSDRRHFRADAPHDVVGAVRSSGRRGWSAPQRLATIASDTFGSTPALVANARGEGLAAWVQPDPTGQNVQVSRVPAGASRWDTPTAVPSSFAGLGAAIPSLSADGRAIVIWKCLCRGGTPLVAAAYSTREPGGDFAPPAPLPDPAEAVDDLALAMNGRGEAVALWTSFIGSAARGASAPAGEGFGPAVQVAAPAASPIGGSARFPAVAINDAGEAIAVWQEGDGLEAARRSPDGTWATARRIVPAAVEAALGLDRRGNALAVFAATDAETGNARVYAVSRRGPTGAWSEPVAISPRGSITRPGLIPTVPSLEMNARGQAVVAWAQRVGGQERVLVRRRAAPGRWGPIEAAAPAQRGLSEVRVALDAGGTATVGWIAETGVAPRIREVVRVATRRVG